MDVCQARTMPRASKNLPLHGWYVISLRPLREHGGVRRSAASFGARAFAVSTSRLEPTDAGASLAQALACPRVVVTSPAAARFAHQQHPLRARRGQAWFAPGAGTAAALARCGIGGITFPASRATSEALLEQPGLRDVAGTRVGLLTAPGGRDVLADGLRRHGATLVVAHVYRRQPTPPSPARLRALAGLPAASALLCSSGEALSVFWQTLDADGRDRLRGRPCVASSARLAARLAELGFATIVLAEDARPASLLHALASHVRQGRFR